MNKKAAINFFSTSLSGKTIKTLTNWILKHWSFHFHISSNELLTFTSISGWQRMMIICLNFSSLWTEEEARIGDPRCSLAHCFNGLPLKCPNLGGKSTAACLPVKTLTACGPLLGNNSFITLPIYLCKKHRLLFLYLFGSLTSLFFIFWSLFSPSASSFSSTKGQDFF